MPDYGSTSYWDERYAAEEEPFDWYQDYSTLRPFLFPYLKKGTQNFEILVPGCGSSQLGPCLYDEGFLNVTNIDISSVVVSQMNDRYTDKEEMEFTVMDARKMEFIPEGCFDLIIDKALMDALLCGPDNISSVNALCGEMYRVLKPGGAYIVISHGAPDVRLGYLQRNPQWGWSVEHTMIAKPPLTGEDKGKSKNHFIYVCTKNS